VPEAHCKVTCAALKAGCHVIGEKPMANSMAEARKMVHAAEQADRMYMVSQSRRWNPMHETARRQVGKGRIGTLSSATCDFFLGAHFGGFRAEMDSPLILDMAIHHFDLVRFITGKDPVAVYAHEWNPPGSWYRGDVAASCIFEMTDGVTFSYRGSWCAEGRQTSWNGDWRFQGQRGSMIYAQDELPVVEVVAKKSGFHRGCRPLKVNQAAMKHPRMHGALREMLAYLRKGTLPQTECHDNIKSLAMVFAAIESSSKRRRVEIKTGV
jgi:predicted dehydrogenase